MFPSPIGLPYFVGGIIEEEKSLLVADEALFRERFNIQVHIRTEVLSIDREKRTIEVLDLASGEKRTEAYKALVLSPGASLVRPPLPGINLPGIFTLRSIRESRLIRNWIDERQTERAAVIGGGLIGLEMAENLAHRNLAVSSGITNSAHSQ